MTALPPLEHDPGALRELADRLASDPANQESAPGLMDRLGEFVLRVIVRLLDSLVGAFGSAAMVGWIIAVVGIVAVGLVAWRVLRGASRDRSGSAAPLAGVLRHADDWRAEAAEHEAAGRIAEAVLARYRAAVATLVDAGLLDDVPGRTVREIDVEVAAAVPTIAEAVAAAGAAVDRVWYGRQAAGPADLDAAVHADAAAEQATSRRAVGAR